MLIMALMKMGRIRMETRDGARADHLLVRFLWQSEKIRLQLKDQKHPLARTHLNRYRDFEQRQWPTPARAL